MVEAVIEVVVGVMTVVVVTHPSLPFALQQERVAKPEDVAVAVAYLVSDEAACVTGQVGATVGVETTGDRTRDARTPTRPAHRSRPYQPSARRVYQPAALP